MTVWDMQDALRTSGRYETPAGAIRHQVCIPHATVEFYLRMVGIFISGSYHARKSDFEKKEWALFGFKMLRMVESIGGRVEFSGFENVKDVKFPVVWTSNHMSSLETYLLPSVLTTYSGLIVVLKESLAHYPFFGRVVRAVRPIRLMRKSPIEDLRKVITMGGEGVAEGRSPLVFPQGARWSHFDPKTFNSMGVKLAQKNGIPLVPLAVRTDLLGMSKYSRDLGPVRPTRPVKIACGKPIMPDRNPKDMLNESVEFVVETLRGWERESGDKLLSDGKPSTDGF